MGIDRQPVLEGATLRLRALVAEDREPLYKAASDPKTWAGHPVKNRHERAVFDPYFDFLLSTAETLVVIDKHTDRVIGCSRYYTAPKRPGTIAVGFTFLSPDYWGGDANFEMKTLMLDHAFTVYDEMWLDIGEDNIRSQKATAKLGAVLVNRLRDDLGTGSEADYLCFRVTKSEWAAVRDSR